MLHLMLPDETMVAITNLKAVAASKPVHLPDVAKTLKTTAGMDEHLEKMREQTLILQESEECSIVITYCVETGHPCGTCRHLAISTTIDDTLPSPSLAMAFAKLLGFTGALEDWTIWIESLEQKRKAVNIVQDVKVMESEPPDKTRLN